MLFLLAGGILSVFLPRLQAKRVQGPFEAAALLETELQKGKNELTFREEDIDLDEVYAALESMYPYAFSIRATTRANKTTTLCVELSRPARQQQAWEYAKQLAQAWVTPNMNRTQQLRALHDGLIRLCAYDTTVASLSEKDGATAPFAADGALLDHRAVCAGYGRAYVMLCAAAGIDNVIYISSEKMNHGWNAVRVHGVTYLIDCTFDDPVPDRGEFVTDYYFLGTVSEFEETHEWDQTFYEQELDYLEQQKE